MTGYAFSGGVRSMQIFMSFLFLLLFIDTLQGLGLGRGVCWASVWVIKTVGTMPSSTNLK